MYNRSFYNHDSGIEEKFLQIKIKSHKKENKGVTRIKFYVEPQVKYIEIAIDTVHFGIIIIVQVHRLLHTQ